MCGKSLRESKITNTKKQRRYRLRKEQELGKERINENKKTKEQKLMEIKMDPVKYKQH